LLSSPLSPFWRHSCCRRFSRRKPRRKESFYVLLDERADSINNGFFALMMDGFQGQGVLQQQIVDWPSAYHNGAGGFSFADGHSEIHRWVDPRTTPPIQSDFHLAGYISSTKNPDVLWLQQRATGKK
jgi:prepilin-type processing-associated H-X9-DG protein